MSLQGLRLGDPRHLVSGWFYELGSKVSVDCLRNNSNHLGCFQETFRKGLFMMFFFRSCGAHHSTPVDCAPLQTAVGACVPSPPPRFLGSLSSVTRSAQICSSSDAERARKGPQPH